MIFKKLYNGLITFNSLKSLFKDELLQQNLYIHSKVRYYSISNENNISTIYALSSGYGKCGVAVIRISGPQAQKALEKMTKIKNLEARKTFLKNIFNPDTREVIDKGLCIWFPGPTSFTGEDSVEFQVHGGTAILNALFASLSQLGFRQAEPGEFTQRAFFNKKLDLSEVEGLADLIHAETEQQRKQALLQANGSLSKLYNQWRQDLLHCAASLEAYVDFAEDDNIEDGILEICNKKLNHLRNNIIKYLSDGRKGEILRSGARTIILGEPNVGKSSLLNHLAQRNAAIVTPLAGTTRDIVELNINISGYPVLLADTAGLTDSNDIVEKEGIKRARSCAEEADLIILMINGSKLVGSKKNLDDYVKDYIKDLYLQDLLMSNAELSKNCCLVINKMDLIEDDRILKQIEQSKTIGISCKKMDLNMLMEFLNTKLSEICGNPTREHPVISHLRHKEHLKRCVQSLNEYFDISSVKNYDMVIGNQKIRDAMREIEKITGHISTEEILDIIFKEFCIGK